MLNGTLVKDEWYLLKKIGEGAFGEIYSARNIHTNKVAAIKLERVDSKKQVLKLEVAALKRLQTCPHVTRLLTCGKFRGREIEWNFMIMDLFGENLSELRKQQGGRFDMTTTLRIGIRCLSLIEEVHTSGYVHRDVKPSNFVVGLAGEKRRNIYMIDFGLARRFLSSEGELRIEREFAGFRGTARYASINSHLGKDLSRRDDVWSIFFILVEFGKGSLPWRRLKEKDKVGEMKISSVNADFVRGLPPEFLPFLEHLQSLQFHDQPNYSLLRELLHTALRRMGGNDTSQFPWENSAPPPRLLANIKVPNNRACESEVTELSTFTLSREYSRGGSADLMMTTSDSHEKSETPQKFLKIPRRDSDVDTVPPLPSTPRQISPDTQFRSNQKQPLRLSDHKDPQSNPQTHPQPDPETNPQVDSQADIEGKGAFIDLELSETTKSLHLMTRDQEGRRRGRNPKPKKSKDSSKKKKQTPQREVSSCGCSIL